VNLTVFAVLTSPAPLAVAQEATPSATPDLPAGGVLATARREFIRTGTHLVGTGNFSFIVAEFDTEAHAEAAIPAVIERMTNDPKNGLENLERTSTMTFRDVTRAYTGKVEFDGAAFDAALLIVRDGPIVHVWLAGGPNADPLFDLYAIANTTFSERAGEVGTPSVGNLEALLPTLDDLPPGFVLEREESFTFGQATAAAQ
jgi:hypothetical protein